MYVEAADPDTSVEAPPSLLPAKRYCDITGLQVRGTLTQAPYTDPKTRLRYHSAEIYDIVKGFVRVCIDNRRLAWTMRTLRCVGAHHS